MLEVNIIQKNGKKVIMASSYTFFWLRLFTIRNAKHHFHVHFFQRKKKWKEIIVVYVVYAPKKYLALKMRFWELRHFLTLLTYFQDDPFSWYRVFHLEILFMMKIKWKVEDSIEKKLSVSFFEWWEKLIRNSRNFLLKHTVAQVHLKKESSNFFWTWLENKVLVWKHSIFSKS